MVLWEITLATAYFLGLKRSYRLALKAQRRLLTPNHSKIRHLLHRRTRAVFGVAIKVHQSIQERDLQVGRNMQNFIFGWLDRMKTSAKTQGGLPINGATSSLRMTKLVAAHNLKTPDHYRLFKRDTDKYFFTSSSIICPKPFPYITRMMRPPNPAGTTAHCRHFNFYAPDVFSSNYKVNWSQGVIRKDIMQWMLQN
ncbi:uncharacterized protein LOC113859146 [Abrus precatorius]|uniref:Uncharacterized protein LOC113859146 n=1 Tax=Abrus precatorius TaxID=3816 RepID=A0A8B8KZF4_ABRPR|nr:uncharacterized protein LOC113859146 [Abrus precatorius]